MNKLDHTFFNRPSIELARALIGTILVRRRGRRDYRARIVETEAYVGTHDLACHASKGRTKRTEVMFGPAGRAYVYFIYGMYDMLNIVAAEVDDAQAVLIRAAEPLDDWAVDLSGPGKLCRAMKITRKDNGRDLTGASLFLLEPEKAAARIETSARIGVDYAKEWRDAPLRFFDTDSAAVSKMPGRKRIV